MSTSIRNLRRGAVVNLLGYAAQALRPVLLVAVTAAYGDTRWGVYSAIEATLWLSLRLVLGGLDRGLLYWIPRSLHEHGEVRGLWSCVARVLLQSVAAALALSIAMPLLAAAWEQPEAVSVLRLFALALIPLAQLELLAQASVARERLEWATLSREVVAPYTFLGGALLLRSLGFVSHGLAIAYMASQTLAALTAAYGLKRALSGLHIARDRHLLRMPRALRRYSRPLVIAEIGGTALGRIDQLLLSFLLPVGQLGVYDMAKRLARLLTTVRGSYEHMVTAMVATLSGGGTRRAADTRALGSNFSYATVLVLVTQAPIVATFLAYGQSLLSLSGAAFETGAVALHIFAISWFCLGLFGLGGQVVNGLGRSDLSAWAATLGLAAQLAFIAAIVPVFGLEGAAAAVGLSVVLLGCVQTLQARALVGSLYRTGPLRVFGAGMATFLVQWAILRAFEGTAWSSAARWISLIAFILIFGPVAGLHVRRRSEPDVPG